MSDMVLQRAGARYAEPKRALLLAGARSVSVGESITVGDVTLRVELIVGGDDETAALLREATRLADLGEWDAAIDALTAAKARMIDSPVHYPGETWCKLALYLSRAGRFEESMAEFDWLLADLPRRARKESYMDDPSRSFGRGTSKRSIYNQVIRNGKRVIAAKRAVALRRQQKAK